MGFTLGHTEGTHALNIVGCLLTKRLTMGGGESQAPQDPPWATFFVCKVNLFHGISPSQNYS